MDPDGVRLASQLLDLRATAEDWRQGICNKAGNTIIHGETAVGVTKRIESSDLLKRVGLQIIQHVY